MKKLILLFLITFTFFEKVDAEVKSQEIRIEKFVSELKLLQKKNNILGLSVGIVKDNVLIWSDGYGFVDSDRTVRMTADTPLWIASITKSFVALTMLQLEAENLINTSELASETPNFNGLCQWLSTSSLPFGEDLNCDSKITIKNILNHQVNGSPGTRFLYNPIMYSRLSRYLEHKLGNGIDFVEGRHNLLAQSIDRLILIPADMTRTMSSQWDRTKSDVYFDMGRGFTYDGNQYKKSPSPDRHIAGGAGIVSTVNDLAKYDIAINNGTIANSKIKEKLFSSAKFENGHNSPYGFGWYFQNFKNKDLMWHSGWDSDAGYSSFILKVPQEQITFIALANTEGLNWNNPLDKAEIDKSPFALLFLKTFIEGS
ncbi:serine hydrolase domain-containing protein [Marinicella sp. W31]|uniref:serine hydrolase domain-containing protein n=1 Tax=Marinicella sp. W31 TaxID=3023713 RepID=UPI0037579F76